MGIIPNGYKHGLPIRILQLLGEMPHSEKGVFTGEVSNRYDKRKWAFLLDAPFKISNRCCSVMKKDPVHRYGKETGRKPITAQMTEESKLRQSVWIRNGCNAFDANYPISNPMSFWTEQDVLHYIKENNIEIAPVYGDIVFDDGDELQGQMDFADFGLDKEVRELKTTRCQRTGCTFCGYAAHIDKRPNRFELIELVSNPAISDYVLRGGEWKDGVWCPSKEGMGYWFCIKWLNVHGGFNIYIPRYEHYEKQYGDEKTKKCLGE